MSLSFGHHEELREHALLPEILGGTSFVSSSGRIYRLFGNEEETFSVPEIPAIPPFLVPAKSSALSLEEALQEIETYSSPAESVEKRQQAVPPTLQLFHALGESAPLKLVKKESSLSRASVPAGDIIEEVSKTSRKPHDERGKSLRVIFEQAEEPFIVPFTKPAGIPETAVNEINTKNITLKVVTDFVPSIHIPPKIQKYGLHRNIERTPYRKQFSFPPVSVPLTEEPTAVCERKPKADISAFRWSAQLDSLMQSASSQIRMLADHLVVQSNQDIRAICFKSVFPGDGCSTILLCAVRALTERKHRVLLIDAHSRHIDLPKQLNIPGDWDSGNDILPIHEYLGFWVWQRLKPAEENVKRLMEIIVAGRKNYDLILLDGGSLTESPLTEFVEFWNQIGADGIIVVSNTKHPSEIPASHIAERFRQHHIHLIGITENCV